MSDFLNYLAISVQDNGDSDYISSALDLLKESMPIPISEKEYIDKLLDLSKDYPVEIQVQLFSFAEHAFTSQSRPGDKK